MQMMRLYASVPLCTMSCNSAQAVRRNWAVDGPDRDTSRKMFDMLADLTNQPADTKRQKRACTLNQAAAAKCDRQVSAPASTA